MGAALNVCLGPQVASDEFYVEKGEYADFEVLSDVSEIDQTIKDLGEDAPDGLSDIGRAAFTALGNRHPMYKGVCWNVTHGKVIGDVCQTPPSKFHEQPITQAIQESHSDGFVDRMVTLIHRGTRFVDIASLGPPDGKFTVKIAQAIRALHESGKPIVVRFLTGNIVGMPTDNEALLRELTKDLPQEGSNLKLWVGSWRKGFSWNHAKIVAVDGKYLFQGGHNLWDAHYLKWNPVRDVSMEAEGTVTEDGHIFVNRMWQFIEKKDREWVEQFGSSSFKPRLLMSVVGICHYPRTIEDYPPMYERTVDPLPLPEAIDQGDIQMITIGRYGTLHHNPDSANPSDDAIIAMLGSAQSSIKLCLQDLGPLAVPLPTGPLAVPGGVWPKEYLKAIASAIYQRGVNVEIILSTPNSIPADLGKTEANYGNGWTVADVAAEIVRSIKENHPDIDENRLSGLITINLKVTYLRSSGGDADWEHQDKKAANHAKFFIVDDKAYYLGSQNLYIANLAEWGIIIDNEEQTKKVMREYWNPLWKASWDNVPQEERDLNVAEVLQSSGYERSTPPTAEFDEEMWERFLLKKMAANVGGPNTNLVVWLIRATGLSDQDGLGSGDSDSYVRLRVVDKDGNTVGHPWESKVLWDSGSNPEWNQQFTFEGLKVPSECTLKIVVYDKDTILGLRHDLADWLVDDHKLGSAEVKLSGLSKTLAWQHQDVVVDDGYFTDSVLKIALNTGNGWGK